MEEENTLLAISGTIFQDLKEFKHYNAIDDCNDRVTHDTAILRYRSIFFYRIVPFLPNFTINIACCIAGC